MTHGLPGYEQMMRDDYEFAAVIEFDDVDALKAYLAHPSHSAIGRHFTASASKSLAYDYVMVDAAEERRGRRQRRSVDPASSTRRNGGTEERKIHNVFFLKTFSVAPFLRVR